MSPDVYLKPTRHGCTICGRPIARTHFKRHVNAHERHGVPTKRVNAEWLRYLHTIDHERAERLRKVTS